MSFQKFGCLFRGFYRLSAKTKSKLRISDLFREHPNAVDNIFRINVHNSSITQISLSLVEI